MDRPEGLSQKVDELKKTWFSIAKGFEGFSKFESCLDDGFKDIVTTVLSKLEDCEGLVEGLRMDLKYNFPAIGEKVDADVQIIFESLRQYKEDIRGEINKVFELKKLMKQLKEKEEYLEKAERQLREVENQTSEICNKYFERRKEYTIGRDKIRAAVDKRISVVKEEFDERISAIVEGYDVYVRDMWVDVDKLFEILLEKPSKVESIKLKPKGRGFLDSLRGGSQVDKAKTIVLKHEATSILEKAQPIKKAEEEAIRKLDSKFKDLADLEKACKNIENRREELLKAREELASDIDQLKRNELFSYSEQNKVNELKDRYLGKFDDINPKMEDFILFVRELLSDLEKEPDPEKRELRLKIKRLEEEKSELQSKLEKVEAEYASVKEELRERIREVEEEVRRRIEGESSRELEECRERLNEMTTRISELERELKKHFDLLLGRSASK